MQMAVVVKIYNRNGTLVKTIADDQESGDMNISWDGTNDSGQTVSSGIYLLYVKLGHCERREKIAIIR
jgi:flagellar hook assembly protein FlgD